MSSPLFATNLRNTFQKIGYLSTKTKFFSESSTVLSHIISWTKLNSAYRELFLNVTRVSILK